MKSDTEVLFFEAIKQLPSESLVALCTLVFSYLVIKIVISALSDKRGDN